MSSRRRLISALDSFISHRSSGARSKRHVSPVIEFAAAELRARGVRASSIHRSVSAGFFFEGSVDLAVKEGNTVLLSIMVVTQSGSVRKNLNNRRREIVGEAFNLRAGSPRGLVAVLYLLRATAEARRAGKAGTTPIEELAAFLEQMQQPAFGRRALLDGAALVAADQDATGQIRIESTPQAVDVLGSFFDRLTSGLKALSASEQFS